MDNMILDDRYEIIEQIGVGGMAKVYKAKDRSLGRFVAIKILKDQYAEDSEFLKKFNNEAQSAAKLSHVNIVNVFDIGQDMYRGQMVYYIVMEYVDGSTLKDHIVREGKLSNHDIIDYSVQIAQALKTAHQSGIIHRDIKPQNILIDNYGLAKVTDFGIARVSSNATITYTSSILGTVHYISPEQAKGKIVDEKSDLYSLGAVMYEMATGKVPFDADNSVGIAVMHIQDDPVPPKELNPNLSDHLNYIIIKLLDKEPANRFLNAKELIDALENENFIKEDEEDLTDTAKIPIVVPKNNFEDTVYQKQVVEEEPVKKEKEAVYVSNAENKKSETSSTSSRKIWPLVLLAAILLFAVYFLKNRTSTTPVEVPTVINLDQGKAVNELEKKGLRANVAMTEESDEYERGKVMSQDPQPNTKVERNTLVNLVISAGREVDVPDLRNMTLTQADETLKEQGLRLGRANPQASDHVDKDLIISQEPRVGTRLQAGTEIDVTVSTGPDQRIQPIEVPDLKGKSEDEARAVIAQYGLTLRDVSYYNSNNTARGLVMNQSIASGTQVAPNSNIDITISLGPEETRDQTNTQNQNQNQNQNTQTNQMRDVELKIDVGQNKEEFNVTVYKIVDGQRAEVLYNQYQTRANTDNGILRVNLSSEVGTSLEVIIDDESYGWYTVNQ